MALTLSFDAGVSEIDIESWDHFYLGWLGAWRGGGLLTRTWPRDRHSLAPNWPPPSHPLPQPVSFTKGTGKQRPRTVPFHLEHPRLPPHLQIPPPFPGVTRPCPEAGGRKSCLRSYF